MSTPPELDEVDRGILHMLQLDARNYTASEIADEVGVAPNTVRNRIERLTEHDVIQGYHPHIDYERAGFQLRIRFICSVPISERNELATRALEVDGVIEVTEILSGHDNLTVEAVGSDGDDVTRIAEALEERGVTVRDEQFVKNSRVQPFDNFGDDVVEE